MPPLHTATPAPSKIRWRLLLFSFLISLVIGLGYVWLRAPVYQSYAIMHLSYAQPDLEEIPAIAAEQLNIHQQRLTSHRVIALLAEQLAEQKQLHLEAEQLNDMLKVESMSDSRLLKLSATGTNAAILLPTIDSWITLYFSLQENEQQQAETGALADLQGKLGVLEQKIADKRMALEEFTSAHQIISLERDENRVLSQIKGLSNTLDTTAAEKAAAEGQLKALETAIAAGKTSVRPQDQNSLDNMEDRALALEEQLFQLSQQYTPAYMALDPTIVAIKNNLASLKRKTEARRSASQKTYLNELSQTLQALTLKEADIRDKLASLQNQAQNFSHKLSEYSSLKTELEQIEAQAQMIRDQLIQSEVRKPYQAQINILEAPFEPQFPIGPKYLRDSAFATLIALFIALASVTIFALINRQGRADPVLSPYPVFTPLQSDPQQQLSDHSAAQISYQQARELSVEDCQNLLQNAPLHCKLALTLMFNGVNIGELSRLVVKDFDAGKLTISGQYQRLLYLARLTVETVNRVTVDLGPESSVWLTPTGETLELAELERMLKHAGEAAGLNNSAPVYFKDIRHTYLLFLARQGASLNEIEQVAGYLCAQEMEHCQQVLATAQPSTVNQVLTQHPALG